MMIVNQMMTKMIMMMYQMMIFNDNNFYFRKPGDEVYVSASGTSIPQKDDLNPFLNHDSFQLTKTTTQNVFVAGIIGSIFFVVPLQVENHIFNSRHK